uniref:Uncharacterized protein n=1 Tax=Arundo donax TaxID=35708 RepID=A0A0A9C609_ARUDO
MLHYLHCLCRYHICIGHLGGNWFF